MLIALCISLQIGPSPTMPKDCWAATNLINHAVMMRQGKAASAQPPQETKLETLRNTTIHKSRAYPAKSKDRTTARTILQLPQRKAESPGPVLKWKSQSMRKGGWLEVQVRLLGARKA